MVIREKCVLGRHKTTNLEKDWTLTKKEKLTKGKEEEKIEKDQRNQKPRIHFLRSVPLGLTSPLSPEGLVIPGQW
jgi:hypothetical protein